MDGSIDWCVGGWVGGWMDGWMDKPIKYYSQCLISSVY
jgi:hypothetical protein